MVFVAVGAAAISLGRQPDGIAGIVLSATRGVRGWSLGLLASHRRGLAPPRPSWGAAMTTASRRASASRVIVLVAG